MLTDKELDAMEFRYGNSHREISRLVAEVRSLRTQRDELASALTDIVEALEAGWNPKSPDVLRRRMRGRAVLNPVSGDNDHGSSL